MRNTHAQGIFEDGACEPGPKVTSACKTKGSRKRRYIRVASDRVRTGTGITKCRLSPRRHISRQLLEHLAVLQRKTGNAAKEVQSGQRTTTAAAESDSDSVEPTLQRRQRKRGRTQHTRSTRVTCSRIRTSGLRQYTHAAFDSDSEAAEGTHDYADDSVACTVTLHGFVDAGADIVHVSENAVMQGVAQPHAHRLRPSDYLRSPFPLSFHLQYSHSYYAYVVDAAQMQTSSQRLSLAFVRLLGYCRVRVVGHTAVVVEHMRGSVRAVTEIMRRHENSNPCTRNRELCEIPASWRYQSPLRQYAHPY